MARSIRSRAPWVIVGLALAGCVGGGGDLSSGSSTGSSASGSGSSTSSSGGASSSGASSSTSGGTVQPPKRSSYATDCSTASDCVGVSFGGNACCTACATDAIAVKDKARYDADQAAFLRTCSTATPCPAIGCVEPTVTCTNNRCTVQFCGPVCDGGS